mmetsp:Transcript_46918/g.108840  ORF Transcript_46918/g.108840 Transcript_46918/m.108840 type:complete len:141 (-) Transcript_46918:74-496(-)
MSNASSDLLWECVRKGHSFMRKSRDLPTMSAEPGNLLSLHKPAFSGIGNTKALGLSSKKTGKKETILLTQSTPKKVRKLRPKSLLLTTGIKKNKKKGLAQLDKMMGVAYYRPDLLELAKTKYARIRMSFKKPRKGATKGK